MSTAPDHPWHGWYSTSRRHPWQRLAEGDTWDSCESLLQDRAAGLPSGETLVLPAGRHPDATAARRVRAGG